MGGVDITSFIKDGPTALLITLLVLAVIGIIKGYVVPKPFYDKEVKRADDATDALKKNNDVIADLATEMRRIRRNE